jgi:molecular chaperone DnaK
MTYQAGIDLGTTYTAAAVHRDGRVEVVALADRATVIPSVLFLRPEGDVLAGDPANRRGLQEPDRVAREFKRRVGDPAPLYLGGTPLGAHLLLARLLRSTIDRVAEREGGYPSALAITHPANWGPYKLDLLRQAVEHAGFGDYPTTYLSEPEAAAIHYASQERVAPGAIVAAYDLGGGTFDAAVLQRTEDGRFTVLGRPEGIEHLGGIDFDGAVFHHVDQAVGGAVSALDPNDPDSVTAVARLRMECVEAKEVLSSDTEVSIPVVLPTMRTSVRLLRGELEAMIRPAIDDTISALHRALRSAGVTPEQLQSVLLVGGSSRIPLVGQLVSASLGRPVAVDAHPKHAIALGAAVAAAQKVGAAVDTIDVAEPAGAEGATTIPTWSPAGAIASPSTSTAAAPPAGPRRRLPVPLVAGAAVVLIAAVAGAVLASGGSDGDDDPPATTTTVASGVAAGIDPVTGEPAVADRGDAWIFPSSVGGLERQGVIGVDLESGEVLARANTQGFPATDEPIITDDAVWSASKGSPVVLERFSRDDGSLLATVELPIEGSADFVGIVRTAEHLWVAVEQNSFGNQPSGRLFRVVEETAQTNLTLEVPGSIDARTLTTDGERLWLASRFGAADAGIITVEDDAPSEPVLVAGITSVDDLRFSGGSLWAVGDGNLVELEPDELRSEQTIALGLDEVGGTSELLLTADAVSLVGQQDEEAVLVTVDRASGEIETADLGPAIADALFLGPAAGVDADGVRWIYGSGSSTDDIPAELARIDADGEVTTLELPAQPGGGGGLAFAGGRVAVNDLEGGGRLTAPLVRIVDADDLELVETVRADLYPLLVTQAGARLIVTNLEDGTLSIVEDGEVTGTHEIERAVWPGVAVGDEAWALTTDGVAILDLDDPEGEPELVPLELRRAPLLTDGSRVLIRTNPWTVMDVASRAITGQIPTEQGSFVQAASEPLSFIPELVAFGALWESGSETSSRIDLASGAVAPIAVPAPDFAVGDDEMWATDDDGGVHRLDPTTGAVVASAVVGGEGGGRVVVDGDAVWFLDGTRDVRRLDPLTGEELFSVDLQGAPIAATFAAGSLWLSIEGEDVVVRLDPLAEFSSDAVVSTVEVGRRPAYLAGDEDGVWVALQGDLALSRIDPDTDEVTDTLELRD